MAKKILIIDDEKDVRFVLREVLQRAGYEVEVAADARKGLDKLAADGADLVITDVIMPGMDGGKTFDRIREIQPGMLVILASGYAINGQTNKIIRKGCNGFIQKPFNIYELSSKIRKLLDRSHQLN